MKIVNPVSLDFESWPDKNKVSKITEDGKTNSVIFLKRYIVLIWRVLPVGKSNLQRGTNSSIFNNLNKLRLNRN